MLTFGPQEALPRRKSQSPVLKNAKAAHYCCVRSTTEKPCLQSLKNAKTTNYSCIMSTPENLSPVFKSAKARAFSVAAYRIVLS